MKPPITIHVAPGKDGTWDVQVHHWTPAALLAMQAAEESQRRRHAAYGPGRSVTVTLDPDTETAMEAHR